MTSLAQGLIASMPVLAARPGLAFAVIFGVVVVLGALAVFYLIRRMGR